MTNQLKINFDLQDDFDNKSTIDVSDTNKGFMDKSWEDKLQHEFKKKYFLRLKEFLIEEKKKYVVYPCGKDIFAAFNYTSFQNVKVVILGQDPYHGKGQAHGLSFSVPHGIKAPPSLVNIFKELHRDLSIEIPLHGNLDDWARQGVLLLNATLTVRASCAGSHQNKGWEEFTNETIRQVSLHKENVVFLLWGKYAQAKESLIDSKKHCVLKAAHPSPFSAYNGFFGCKHFSKTNDYLREHGIPEINWNIIP
jgi:uracil-DNA glycosylase